ncbi:MAG TPA: TonB-dependent receptor [Kofleriaceae bacterium]
MVASSGVARADEPAPVPAPAVDVADLPPLPAAEDAPVSSATVLAASAVSEDVVVGAAKREQSLGNVASAVTVISGDRIRRFGYRTLGEAIAGVAGAYLVDNRLAYSIGIRGLQIPGDFNTRLLVLIDGASVNEAWGAFAGLGYEAMVSIDEVARIEVIRGPVSSFYGTNAFFGTINIVTRGAAETRGVWATAAVNSVNGPTASAGFTVGDVGHQLRGSVHFMNRIGDTNHVPEITDQALTDDGSYAIGGGLSGVYGGSFAQLRAYRYERQSPFAPYDVDPAGRPYHLHDTQLLAEGGHTHTFSDRLSLTGRLYGNFYQYDDFAPPAGTDPAFITVGTAQTGGAEARVRYELLASGKLGLTAGTEANFNNTVSSAREDGGGPDDLDAGYRYENDGTYAELDAEPVEWFGATAGLRYDIHHDAATDFRTKLSPRVALFFSRPEKYGLKLLYTEGFRAASAFESAFDDGKDFKGNLTIDPEEIRSYEAILWAKPLPGLSLRLSAYHWTVSKLIEQETVVDDPLRNGQQEFVNGGKLRSMGVEAEGSYRDSRGWYGFGGFAYSRVGETELVDAMTNTFGSDFVYGRTVNAPAITASGGISTPKLFGRVHVSTELSYVGARRTRSDDTVQSPDSPGWVGWNATLYAPGIAGFDVTAGVRNIIGTREQVPTPGDYDRTIDAQGDLKIIPRVPAEGRELSVKVGYAY